MSVEHPTDRPVNSKACWRSGEKCRYISHYHRQKGRWYLKRCNKRHIRTCGEGLQICIDYETHEEALSV